MILRSIRVGLPATYPMIDLCFQARKQHIQSDEPQLAPYFRSIIEMKSVESLQQMKKKGLQDQHDA